MEENPKPRRRWFRFSLRTLLVLVTVVCVYLGWAMNWVRQRHEFMQAKDISGWGGFGPHSASSECNTPWPIRPFERSLYGTIVVHEEKLELAKDLFPEATIVTWGDIGFNHGFLR